MVIKLEEEDKRRSQIEARANGLARHPSIASTILPPYSELAPSHARSFSTPSGLAPIADSPTEDTDTSSSTLRPPTLSTSPSLSSLRSTSSGPPRHPSRLPTNFLHIAKHNASITGHYTLDTALSPPGADTRRNAHLETHNGRIDVHIELREGAAAPRTRTTLALAAHNGALTARIRADTPGRAPFWLSAKTHNGAATLRLPRSFAGPLHIFSRNGSVALSDGVRAHAAVVAEVTKSLMNWTSRHTYFLGPLPSGRFDPDPAEPWTATEARIEALNGAVLVCFLDEDIGVTSKGMIKDMLNALISRMSARLAQGPAILTLLAHEPPDPKTGGRSEGRRRASEPSVSGRAGGMASSQRGREGGISGEEY